MVRYDNCANFWLITGLLLSSAAQAQQPDPVRGAEVAMDFERGNCTICHVIPGLPVPVEAQGDLGPSLDGVGARMTDAELWQQITDPRIVMGETIMPAYGSVDGLVDVAPEYRGRPILTKAEIDDLVAFLEELQ